MSVAAADLVLYECSEAPAEDDTTSTIGGTITANTVDGSLDEVFETILADTSGGSDKTRYAKVFWKNTGSDTLSDAKTWINAAPPSGIAWAIGTGSPSDTSTQGTAPGGVSFTNQTGSEAQAITIGTLTGGASISVWVRVILTAGTAPIAGTTAGLQIWGTTT